MIYIFVVQLISVLCRPKKDKVDIPCLMFSQCIIYFEKLFRVMRISFASFIFNNNNVMARCIYIYI